jgi:hypothetical protein
MLKHAARRFATFAFATYGVLWTVIESLSAFVEGLKPSGAPAYLTLIAVSAAVGIWQAWPARRIKLQITGTASTVAVEFGDLFAREGCIAIQVNEFFDSQLGDHVSPNSLHGQFIRDVLGGQAASFDSLVSAALAGNAHETVQRISGNTRKYKIGTTASVDVNGKRYLLFAFARTDTTTLKAHATVNELWEALSGLWEAVRICSNGNPVSVPLVGTGLSGVGLPERQVLDLLILSFAYHTRKSKIAGQVTIILHNSLKSKIDLTSVKLDEE